MPIAFAIVGLVLIVTGARDTYAQLGAQLSKDLTGPGNFTFWIAALALVGALGYIPALKQFSTWFMALVLLALLLTKKNQAVFSQLSTALATGPTAAAPTTAATPVTPAQSSPASPATPGVTFKQSLQRPGGGGFWDFIGAPGMRDWLFGPGS